MKSKFLDAKTAFAKIAKIGDQQKKTDAMVQDVCAAAIFHANTEGDNNAAIGIALFDTIVARDKAKVSTYLVRYGCFKFDKEAKKIAFERKPEMAITNEAGAEKLALILSSNHWTKATPDQDPAAFYDAAKSIAAMVKRIQTEIKEGRGEKINWGTDKVAEVVRAMVVDAVDVKLTITEID